LRPLWASGFPNNFGSILSFHATKRLQSLETLESLVAKLKIW
jgi:hypothetical protein